MYKRKIEKNNEMYLHSRYFFVSLHKSYIIMLKKLLQKIKPKPSVCYYSHLTQHGKRVTKIYLHSNLNKLELKHNLSANPNIKTVLHGKKMFFRFLKNNNFFDTYIHYLRAYVWEIPPIDYIIQVNFTQPFAFHIQKLYDKIRCTQEYNSSKILVDKLINDVKIMYRLSDEWTKILTSIKYINNRKLA